jgi:histidinol-phosphate aminotransferase
VGATVRPTPVIARLKAYDPGHDLPALRARFGAVLAELGSNENPLGPSPRVMDALRAAAPEEVYRYPDPQGLALRRALGEQLGVSAGEIALGNGSHELLMLLAQCFAGPGDEVVFSEFGFAVFPIATTAVGAQPRRAAALPVGSPMPRGHDLDALAAQLGERTRLVYLANPNNPTGTWFTQEALGRFLARVHPSVPVVVDEAYFEYVTEIGTGTALALRDRYRNLIVTRTFSKGYGLAGLRVGYAVADPAIVEIVNRLRESFNVGGLALLAAQAALADPEHVARSRSETALARDALAFELSSLGVNVAPSQTNFLLVDFGRDAAPIERALFERGVVVRPMGGYGLPTCLRVNVGRADENARFVAALREALA